MESREGRAGGREGRAGGHSRAGPPRAPWGRNPCARPCCWPLAASPCARLLGEESRGGRAGRGGKQGRPAGGGKQGGDQPWERGTHLGEWGGRRVGCAVGEQCRRGGASPSASRGAGPVGRGAPLGGDPAGSRAGGEERGRRRGGAGAARVGGGAAEEASGSGSCSGMFPRGNFSRARRGFSACFRGGRKNRQCSRAAAYAPALDACAPQNRRRGAAERRLGAAPA